MTARRALQMLVSLSVAAGLIVPSAPASAAVSLTAKLVEFTPWIQPEGTLRAVMEVSNRGTDPATRLVVSMEVHEGIDTRSALENSFRGRLGPVVVSDTLPVSTTVAPGATEQVVIDKPLSEIRFFSGAPESRAYPVRLVVRSGKIAAAPIDTHMVFFSRAATVPLGVVIVVPLHTPTPYDPQMRVASPNFERSLQEGPIGVIVDSLETHPVTPITIAPSGLFLDTLSDLADGYRMATASGTVDIEEDAPSAQGALRALERIRALAGRDTTSVVVSSYSEANLVWLARSGLSERVQAQVGEARLRVRQVLSAEPAPGWLLPPMGALDETTLAALARSEVTRVIFGASSLPPARGSFTRAAPVQVRSRSAGHVTALVEDPGLSARLKPSPEVSPVQARQRFLAETATIMLERPSEKRAVTALAPIDWSPDPALIEGILLALEASPWMRGVSVEQAVTELRPVGSVQPVDASSILASGPPPPPDSYAERLRRARGAIEDYADLGPPAARIHSLEQTLMIAESADWWDTRRLQSRGLTFAESAEKTVRGEFAKIRAPNPQTITLTSRNGVIPLVISTRTDYPVRVVIRLDSDKLRFPEGTQFTRSLDPPAQTIRVPAVTEASGTFPLRVVVETPNRGVEISSSRLRVRSTAYNLVALAITIGAGGFLVVGWVVGTIRRRFRA